MRRQKGQAVIEFAVVLPLFLLVVFGCIYSGMLFYDYSTLSNIARSAAREAAITQNLNETALEEHYRDNVMPGLVTGLYTYNDTNKPVDVISDATSGSIKVEITMRLDTSSPLMEMVLPNHYTIEYYMKKDSSS